MTSRPAAARDPANRPRHVADSHDLIRVHGARENNLKNISVEIPKRRPPRPETESPVRTAYQEGCSPVVSTVAMVARCRGAAS